MRGQRCLRTGINRGKGDSQRSCCPDTASGGADYACRTGQRSGVHCQWEIPRKTHHSAAIDEGQGCNDEFPSSFFNAIKTIIYNVNFSLIRELSTVRQRMVAIVANELPRLWQRDSIG